MSAGVQLRAKQTREAFGCEDSEVGNRLLGDSIIRI